jgi:DsbC/DsbD-like thiol-disulfide interchange protein
MKILSSTFLLSLSAFAFDSSPRLTVEGVSSARLKAGESASVVLELKVREGFHVQANPASRPQLIPTKVDVTAASGFEISKPSYPVAKPYKIAGLDTMVDTYEGRFEVRIPFKSGTSVKAGKYELDGRIKYQACDDKVCFPPTLAKFRVPIEVVL